MSQSSRAIHSDTAQLVSLEDDRIGLCNASFSWDKASNDVQGTASPFLRDGFKLVVEGEVVFGPGQFNLIIGPTASGKVRYSLFE